MYPENDNQNFQSNHSFIDAKTTPKLLILHEKKLLVKLIIYVLNNLNTLIS